MPAPHLAMRDNAPVAIPQAFIEDLLTRVDIVDVIGHFVPLKKKGADFWGLCPFHAEKTASFSVSPTKQFYHCFGCGQSGNAIGFLMAHTGAHFVEAVQELAQQLGLEVPDDAHSAADRVAAQAARQRRTTLVDVLTQAGQAWYQNLRTTPEAIAYLKARGVRGRTARRFGLGWAPDAWHGLSSVFANYQDPLLEETGLVIAPEDEPQRRYDRFRGRLMFPIRNGKGHIVGFGGRALGDGQPKYLNSPETTLFHKGRELYGFYEARKAAHEKREVLVVEGYMDVIVLAQHGIEHVVATLGTACTPEHLQKLTRLADTIVFGFDGDAAGRRAAARALETALPFATDTRAIKFLFLPPEHDPDSFVRANGGAALAQEIADAVPLSRFLLEVAATDCDMQTAEGRARFATQARPLWQALPPGALAQQLLAELAVLVQIPTSELQTLWRQQDNAVRVPDRAHRFGQRPADGHLAATRNGRKRLQPAVRRQTPPARAQRALQIVLTEPALWLGLSSGDQQLLCDLPAPWGPLFVWLDGQMHEHGARPWSALREALREHPFEATALQSLQNLPPDIVSDPAELQAILALERPHHLKGKMNAALAAGDLALYRALLNEFAALRSSDNAPE